MPPFLLHVGTTAICPHAGQVSIISSNTRVMLGGQPAATLADTYTIAGCTLPVPPSKLCVTIRWLVGAMRVRINGSPAILQNSVGLCQSAEQIPQGPPNVILTQMRVKGM